MDFQIFIDKIGFVSSGGIDKETLYWVFSTIPQVLGAAVALVGMFIFYRINILKKQMEACSEELVDILKNEPVKSEMFDYTKQSDRIVKFIKEENFSIIFWEIILFYGIDTKKIKNNLKNSIQLFLDKINYWGNKQIKDEEIGIHNTKLLDCYKPTFKLIKRYPYQKYLFKRIKLSISFAVISVVISVFSLSIVNLVENNKFWKNFLLISNIFLFILAIVSITVLLYIGLRSDVPELAFSQIVKNKLRKYFRKYMDFCDKFFKR